MQRIIILILFYYSLFPIAEEKEDGKAITKHDGLAHYYYYQIHEKSNKQHLIVRLGWIGFSSVAFHLVCNIRISREQLMN